MNTESMNDKEESVMGAKDHVSQVEKDDLELSLSKRAAVKYTLITLDEGDPRRIFEQRVSEMKGVSKILA